MTSPASMLLDAPARSDRSAAPASRTTLPAPWGTVARVILTLVLLGGYFMFRDQVLGWLQDRIMQFTGSAERPTTVGVWVVAALLGSIVLLWRRTLARDKRFHAPLLVTAILIMGDSGFGILENHYSSALARWTGGYLTHYSPTFLAILATVLTEIIVGRFFYGKMPHLASAYVSGISAGILIKSPELWPFVMCGIISITSKYVLRIGDRHLWNPTNFGVTMMLFLAPQQVASLTVQAGNEVWAAVVIWILGGMILYQLGRLYQPVAFVVTFIPLAIFRSYLTGNSMLAEIAPITSPMFQLYIFFMITDPKTTTKSKWSQILVVVLVAVMETVYRLAFRDQHSLYHALFTVGPIANLIEIAYLSRRTRPAPALVPA